MKHILQEIAESLGYKTKPYMFTSSCFSVELFLDETISDFVSKILSILSDLCSNEEVDMYTHLEQLSIAFSNVGEFTRDTCGPITLYFPKIKYVP